VSVRFQKAALSLELNEMKQEDFDPLIHKLKGCTSNLAGALNIGFGFKIKLMLIYVMNEEALSIGRLFS
jgi:hypothetical protein